MDQDQRGASSSLPVEVKVNNAGIILLWPFLSSFFSRLALVEHGVFKDEDSRHRGVLLLQYLVFKSVETDKSLAVLNKLLVGLPYDSPLEEVEEMTEYEKELCESLLLGMIGNWEKLKSTSAEGIQHTFLQRDGVFSIGPDEILLKIERRGVDILLEFLPWGISTVKLPWMMEPIYVEW